MGQGGKMNPIMRNLLKSFVPQIKEGIQNIDPFLKQKLEDVELLPGEDRAIFLITVNDEGVASICTVTVDEDDKLTRVIDAVTVGDFITGLMQMI